MRIVVLEKKEGSEPNIMGCRFLTQMRCQLRKYNAEVYDTRQRNYVTRFERPDGAQVQVPHHPSLPTIKKPLNLNHKHGYAQQCPRTCWTFLFSIG
jgi:hypothetical protein